MILYYFLVILYIIYIGGVGYDAGIIVYCVIGYDMELILLCVILCNVGIIGGAGVVGVVDLLELLVLLLCF